MTSAKRPVAGYVLTALVALFLVFDTVLKVLRLAPAIQGTTELGYPAGLVLGAAVFVCDNLSFSGEVKLARKHTSMIERDLPGLVGRAVGLLGDLRHA